MRNSIKMRVTPQQSEKIQEMVLKNGGDNGGENGSKIYTDMPYLIIDEKNSIFYERYPETFNDIQYPEVEAESFIEECLLIEEKMLENQEIINVNQLAKILIDLNISFTKEKDKLKVKDSVFENTISQIGENLIIRTGGLTTLASYIKINRIKKTIMIIYKNVHYGSIWL